jgi:hypothetical protein
MLLERRHRNRQDCRALLSDLLCNQFRFRGEMQRQGKTTDDLPTGDLPQLETVPPNRTLPDSIDLPTTDLPTLEQVPPPSRTLPGSGNLPTLEQVPQEGPDFNQGVPDAGTLSVVCSGEAGLEKDPETGKYVCTEGFEPDEETSQCVPVQPVAPDQTEEKEEQSPPDNGGGGEQPDQDD